MKILNFGSLNVDYVYRVDHIVRPGETQNTFSRELFAGGKGLNQSIALSRAGLNVCHAGQVSVGNEGDLLCDTLRQGGVDPSLIRRIDAPCGHTVIQVDSNGQNSILLFGGANRTVDEQYRLSVFSHFSEGDVLVLQNEVNDTARLIELGHEKGMTVVLNPSPFDTQLEACDWKKVDIIFLNEIEGAQLTGTEKPSEILDWFGNHLPHTTAVLTLGGDGAYCICDGQISYQPIFSVPVVDTTAAGDTFTGFFLRTFLDSGDASAALRMGAKASSITVSRPGAAQSIPDFEQVCEALKGDA